MNFLTGTCIYRCRDLPGYVHLYCYSENLKRYFGEYFIHPLDVTQDPIYNEKLEGEAPGVILSFNEDGSCREWKKYDLSEAVRRMEK